VSDPRVSCFVVTAKAGTQGFQSLALDPAFAGATIKGGYQFDYNLESRDLLLPWAPGFVGEAKLSAMLYGLVKSYE
jgi:hypothetical protein